jgi:hypothetical protein
MIASIASNGHARSSGARVLGIMSNRKTEVKQCWRRVCSQFVSDPRLLTTALFRPMIGSPEFGRDADWRSI